MMGAGILYMYTFDRFEKKNFLMAEMCEDDVRGPPG